MAILATAYWLDTLLLLGHSPSDSQTEGVVGDTPPAEGVADSAPLRSSKVDQPVEGVASGSPTSSGEGHVLAEGVGAPAPNGAHVDETSPRAPPLRRPWHPSPPVDAASAGPTVFAVSRQQQLADPGTAFIIRALENNVKRHSSALALNFCIRDGLLRRRAVTALGEVREAIVVPEPMRDALMNLIHYSLIAGHTGHERMVEWLRPRFWWYNLDGDCVAFCKACETCSGLRSETFPNPLT